MVNFHSGGFIHGSPDPSGYRLHVLGYLNLNLKVCSGNQGLKDAILSLQWIKENISVFGGDPDNITLMGSSAGSVIVHFMLLSPLAKGLYHKAILMGCYAFIPVAICLMENASVAYKIAQMLGYDGKPDDNKKLLNFYKSVELSRLFLTRPEYLFNTTTIQVYPQSPFLFTPEPGENSPLPVSPEKLIPSTNRVPIIIGFSEREACITLVTLRALNTPLKTCFYKAIQQNCWGWAAALNEDELKRIQKEVENFYLAGESIETASQSVLCDILTDIALSDVYDSVINVISADLPSSVYVYNFHYDGKLCVMKAQIERSLKEPLPGAFHGADYSYWCYNEEMAGKTMARIQPNDRKIVDTLTNLLTTFAKTSNPNYDGLEVEWKPTTPDSPSYLIINEKLQIKDELLNGERMEFWHRLKNKFVKSRTHL
ncbi:esterase E4-like [Planococcus citri]|uniref:esterase E4-like n=1 Tax=Planococcus citri TaxID=170843 RepID=UPI0031F96B5C